VQLSVMTALARRNAQTPHSDTLAASRIHTPFILVQTDPQTDINCQTTEDQSEWSLDFSAPFELHNEIEVLQHMQTAGFIEQALPRSLCPSHSVSDGVWWEQLAVSACIAPASGGSALAAVKAELGDPMDTQALGPARGTLPALSVSRSGKEADLAGRSAV
jgi:hypothetical protein